MKKDNILSILMNESEIRWQSLIYNMVRSGKINPWDVDIELFTKEYLKILEKLKQMNFRLSGKVVLTAAILLKLKTNRIGLEKFLELIEEESPDDELTNELGNFALVEEEMFVDEDEQKLKKLAEHMRDNKQIKNFVLEPNLSRKRQRKVTVFELVSALKKAIEVDERRTNRRIKKQELPKEKPPEFEIRKANIKENIRKVYHKIISFFKSQNSSTIAFTKILPSSDTKEIIWTFIPLLYLANQGKISLSQKRAFDEIYIKIKEKNLKSQ